MKRFGDARDWFFSTRFGLFIHWGIYAIPAWHEQIQWRRGIPRADYEKLIDEFNPVRFDPDEWLDRAAGAGMEYVTFTTKHHDGFCLWDTAQTDYNVMNSPYGQDILARLAEACRRRGFPLCLYYSVADWHHPNYPNQNRSHELPGPEPGDEPDLERYLDFLRAQVRELCTDYGELSAFWWDMNVTERRDPSINEMIRSLQPGAVINNRGFDDGDFGTPERDADAFVDEVRAFEERTEACQSIGEESWGFKEDEDYYTERYLLQSIDKVFAKGGRYLLNVGPRADGTFPPQADRALERIGDWYGMVREAFDDAEPASHLIDHSDVLLTQRDNVLYVHLFKPPIKSGISLKPLNVEPRKATLLNTGGEVAAKVELLPSHFEERTAYLRLRDLPANDLADTVMVVKLEFDGAPG